MKREELLQLYREEKDPNVKDRLMLNIKVRFEDVSITKAARSLGKATSWGSKWFSRFAKADVEGLRNLPRSGRPPRITREEAEKIWKEMDGKQYWTAAKTRELVSGETGVRYSLSSIYKMLKRWEYSLKVPVKRHIRRPPDEEIIRFQEELARLIPQKIEEGYVVAVQDESIVLADARPGKVYTKKGRLHRYRLPRKDDSLRTADHGRPEHVRAVRQVHQGGFCGLPEEGIATVPEDPDHTGQGAAAHRQHRKADREGAGGAGTEVPSARMPGSQLHGGEVKADEAQSAGCAVCYPGPPAKRDHPLSAVPDAHAANRELSVQKAVEPATAGMSDQNRLRTNQHFTLSFE